LHATKEKDHDNRHITQLSLQPQSGDPKDLVAKATLQHHHPHDPHHSTRSNPKDDDEPHQIVPRRRRHTYEDAKMVENDLQAATNALKSSRIVAQHKQDGVRMSLNAFKTLHAATVAKEHKDEQRSHPHLSWLGAYNRVRQRTQVDLIKRRMDQPYGPERSPRPSPRGTNPATPPE
jgi:hypothetical protein